MVFDDSAYRNKPGYIYLIRAVGTDRYKIGLTTRSVEARFAELNSSQSPFPLELIDWFETDDVTADEGYLHEKFASYRVHNEWFSFDKRTLSKVRIEYQDTVVFTWPSLPNLSLRKGMRWTKNRIALAMASIGALWLIVVLSGCLPKITPNNSTPSPPHPVINGYGF
ncbi:MAG: GIY-YIG nuclease family protein [Symploca sp. SIO2D2]|nr:GIY-YIG nuclease family protein [Symploca sp. SIO2D2]